LESCRREEREGRREEEGGGRREEGGGRRGLWVMVTVT
jgi:hypothetical protein